MIRDFRLQLSKVSAVSAMPSDGAALTSPTLPQHHVSGRRSQERNP